MRLKPIIPGDWVAVEENMNALWKLINQATSISTILDSIAQNASDIDTAEADIDALEGAGFITDLSGFDTDDLAEGSSNKYFPGFTDLATDYGISGVSGTLVLDDGTTEKITLVFTNGILTSRTVETTTGSALIDWTD